VVPPRFVPPPIADLQGLTAWMCFSSFLQRLDLQQLQRDNAQIL